MLDHDQMNAPQFQADVDPTHGTLIEPPVAQVHAGAAPCLRAMMFMPLQIAMALPAAVLVESSSSSILRHLSWQRERARR